jgi:hypothetical protein
MKSLAVALLIALTALGGAAVADAQTGNAPAGTQAPAITPPPTTDSSTKAGGSVSTPSGEVKGQVTTDRKSESRPSDDGSALPRAVASERTTIFGLSPTAAVVIAAALLVVVILAIVAMTRSNDTYIDTNRHI